MTAQMRTPQQPSFKLFEQRFITFSKNDSIESIMHAYPAHCRPEAFPSTAGQCVGSRENWDRGKCGNGNGKLRRFLNCRPHVLDCQIFSTDPPKTWHVDISMEHLYAAPRFYVSE
jgi:hypothetical protein